jgi:hypothetical protein
MRLKWMVFGPLALAAFALFIVVGGEVVKLLWNALLPPLFGWPAIGFWQALGLLALSRILFGSWGGGCRDSRVRRRWSERWDERVAERVSEGAAHMTPEEWQRYRQRLRERLGLDPASHEPGAPKAGE